ncbi:MAG: S-layer homology domain-containing protein [Clostridia bacterium]|nr:S-layer homology domain-containing protein [Clostridia bacterium]
MKKLAALWMVIVLLLCLSFPAQAEENAVALNTLGLFKGTENGFELEKSLTRAEAVTLLVRVLGKEAEAEKMGKTHPFSDVAPWADGYISIAYENGLTNGISDTLFGANDKVESNMYLTFLLRALGYEDGENLDFIWQMPYALAGDLEMLPIGTELKNFTRKDAVTLTAAALFAKEKEKETTLSERLIAEGVFSEEDWQSAFPVDPFAYYKKVNRGVGKAIPFHAVENNRHNFYNYLLLSAEEKENGIYAHVIESLAEYRVYEGNEIGSQGSGMRGGVVILDKTTYEPIGTEGGGIRRELFPESAIGSEVENFIWKGMNTVLGRKVDKAVAEGVLAYKQPTHDEYIAHLKNDDMNYITKTYETDLCTILVGYLGGTPHGSFNWLRAVYKEGSPLGDGKVISLPLPDIRWSKPATPSEIIVSADGKTATYSFFFESDLILDPGQSSEQVIHEAGTYVYTTNLLSGETTLEIIK